MSERVVAVEDDRLVLEHESSNTVPHSLRTGVGIALLIGAASAIVPAVVFYPRVGAMTSVLLFAASFGLAIQSLAVHRSVIITPEGIFNERHNRFTRSQRTHLVLRWSQAPSLRVVRKAGLDAEFDAPVEVFELVDLHGRPLWSSTSREVAEAVLRAAEEIRFEPANLPR
jgi:hypothetical protein